MRERSSRPNRAYAAIPNAAMRNTAISMEARGLLALLMTYADSWVFRRDHLMEVTGWGRDKFSKHMGELREAGYVELVMDRAEGGKLIGTTWVIRDENHRGPEIQSLGFTEALKNRPPAKPTSGESAPIRRTRSQEDQQEESPKPPEGASDLFSANGDPVEEKTEPDRFDEFWKVYPKKAGKPAAQKAWAKAIKRAPAQTIIDGARRYAHWLSQGGPKDFRPIPKFPQGWLNDDRWDDEEIRHVRLPDEVSAEDRSRRFAPQWGEVVR